jgi:glycosyltransferase involved in cell wall biosynthesis
VTVHRLPLRPFPGGRTGLHAWRKAMVLISALPGDQSRLLGRMARAIPPILALDERLDAVLTSADCVHGFNISWEYPLHAGAQRAGQHGLPFVVTPFMHFGTGHDRVARNSTMDHQRRLLHAADRVLVLTAIEQAGLIGMGLPADRVAVIGGGVDAPPPPPPDDGAALRRAHRLTAPFVLFIGRITHDKGAFHAAAAVLALAASGLRLQLGLIGHPSPEFRRFHDRLSDREREVVRLIGPLDEAGKHTLLAGASGLLLPSRTDSFGIVLLEAWAHGVPVIGAAAGGIPGVIDDGENGLLVPFGDVGALADGVRRLVLEPDFGRKLGAHGRHKVATRYTWPAVARLVETHYHAVRERPR